MKKALVPKCAIDGFILNTKVQVVCAYCVDDSGPLFKGLLVDGTCYGYKDTDFTTPSETLMNFFTEAALHFKPLVELPMTEKELVEIAEGSNKSPFVFAYGVKELLKERGFKFKDTP